MLQQLSHVQRITLQRTAVMYRHTPHTLTYKMNVFPPWCTYGFQTNFTVNSNYLTKSINLICLSIEVQRVFCQVGVEYLTL
jgi:hypothetical protein